jgi:hypothetical protein
MKGITKLDEAYYSGYFDGEGMVRIQNVSVMVQIHTCYPYIVRDIARQFGGNIQKKPIKASPNWRPSYQWRTYGKEALRFLGCIYPFSREKKRQIKLALKFYKAGKLRREAIRNKITTLKREVYK